MPVSSPDLVTIELPFQGRWRAGNSPARRVPSHGTDLFGSRYAIDFVAVDDDGRSAPSTWRSWLATEAPDGFVGFGRPVLGPVAGTVVATHDGEVDHEARRSQLSLIPYALGQARRVRGGPAAIAGNHVVIRCRSTGRFVWLVHLRRGSVRVRPGDRVIAGDQVGACGNSGNSTEPHLHLQVTDGVDWRTMAGVAMVFGSYRRIGDGRVMANAVPGESEIIEPVGAARGRA